MENVQLQDESGDRKYFTQIPNYALDNLKHWDREVYIQIKRICGDKGSCWTSRSNLAKQCGMSLDRFKKSIKYLTENDWISFVGKKKVFTKGGEQEVNEYRINDIWKKNVDFYNKGGSTENPPIPKGGSSNCQRGVVDGPKGGSSNDYKEEQDTKKITPKEERKTPAQIAQEFFTDYSRQEEVVRGLTEKGLNEQLARREIKKFISYWTESSKNGRRLRWEGESYFDLSKRLATWFGRVKDSNFKKGKGIIV